MNGRFITKEDIARETFEWGETGWVSRPSFTGSTSMCVMDVSLSPGGGHAFHRHPDQEEIIWVREGRIEQWLESERQELGPGEAVYIPKDVVHASFNVGSDTARLQVVLGPAVGDGGDELVDVANEEPWSSLR